MKKILALVLTVATLGVAAFFLYKKFVKRAGENGEDYASGEEPTPAKGFPVWPAILTGEVKGKAAITKNPGNLRVSGDNWQGKTGEYQGFEAFADWAYGTRALLKTLKTYLEKYGCNTIEKVITRYAPPSENNTQAYIQNVMLWTGKQPDQTLTKSDLPALATAIIRQETGISSANTNFLFNYVKQVNEYFGVL